MHWLAFSGFGGTGLIPGRPIDNWSIGYYYASFASGLKDLDPPYSDIRDEQGLEVFYNYAVTPWLVFGADVQFIRTMLLVKEMALKHPEVRFSKVSTSTGIEMIEKAGSSAG